MDAVTVVIEIQEGVPEITEIAAPAGVKVSVTIRDYDTDGADPEDLTLDPDGIPCFESGTDYENSPDQPGFV